MARRNRTPRRKCPEREDRELLQLANIGSMDDIQSLFKTIAQFMENGLEAELDDELGYSNLTTKTKIRTTAITGSKKTGNYVQRKLKLVK